MAITQSIKNLFSRWFGRSSNSNYRIPLYQNADSGELVTPITCLHSGPFAACIDILSSDIGGLPFPVYERTEDGRRWAYDHPLYPLIHDAPNEYMTSQNWRENAVNDILIRGNGYAYLEKSNGEVVAIYPIPSQYVHPIRDNGVLYYLVDGFGRVEPQYILHIPGLNYDGISGVGVIENHAQTIGINLAVDKFAATFYRNGATLNGVVEFPNPLNADTVKEFRQLWQESFAGALQAHQTPVLTGGAKYNAISIPPEQSQFLETRKYSAIEICRLPGLRVPPHFLAELDRMTWNNIGEMGQAYVTYSLRRWVLKFENEINRKCFTEKDKSRYYCEMQVDALQRGNQQQRFANYAIGIQNGFMTAKQIAELENWDTAGLSDKPLQPLNMQPVENSRPPRKRLKNSSPNREIYRVLIEDAANRIIQKEKTAILRLAKKHLPENIDLFETNVSEFVENNVDFVKSVFRPVILTYNAKQADKILNSIAEDCKNYTLDNLIGKTSVEEIERVWNDRAINISDKFCGGKL